MSKLRATAKDRKPEVGQPMGLPSVEHNLVTEQQLIIINTIPTTLRETTKETSSSQEGKERVTFQDDSRYLTCLEVPQKIRLVRLACID